MICGIPFQTALLTAVLNIQIPLELGGLVNVVAGLTPGLSMEIYMERLVRPGLRLCMLYLTQVQCEIVCSCILTFSACTARWSLCLCLSVFLLP